jgi:hypothetical protein
VVEEALLAQGMMLKTCGPGDHVQTIKWKIRIVKDRLRSLNLSLPFERVPKVILIQAIIFLVMWLHFFWLKGGASTHMSPQTIMTCFSPDAAKRCHIPFGGYAQIYGVPAPTNDVMVSRTVGGICLGLIRNIQGTYAGR